MRNIHEKHTKIYGSPAVDSDDSVASSDRAAQAGRMTAQSP